jgi:hypothetical protein
MRAAGVLPDRLEPDDIAKALDDGGLAGAAAADKDVEVVVESEANAIEETTLPSHGDKLRVSLWRWVVDLAYPRAGSKESLSETFY